MPPALTRVGAEAILIIIIPTLKCGVIMSGVPMVLWLGEWHKHTVSLFRVLTLCLTDLTTAHIECQRHGSHRNPGFSTRGFQWRNPLHFISAFRHDRGPGSSRQISTCYRSDVWSIFCFT